MDDKCSYGKVTRNMVENVSTDFKEFRDEIRTEFKDLKSTNQTLYNHLSDRLPRWAVVIGGIGIALLSGAIGFIMTSIVK